MLRPNFSLPSKILIYGAKTYLGLSLNKFWQDQKVPVVALLPDLSNLLEQTRAKAKVVFVSDPLEDNFEQVAALKKILEIPRNNLDTLTIITSLYNEATDSFLEKTIQERLPNKWQVVRVPTVYGVGASLGFLGILGDYLRELLNNEPLLVFGEGLTKYPLISVADVVNQVSAIIDSGKTAVFPLLPTEVLTELELAYLVKSLATKKPAVVFSGHSRERTKSLNLDGLENLKDFNFRPTAPLREGLRQIITNLEQPKDKPTLLPKVVETKPVEGKQAVEDTKKPKNKTLTYAVATLLLAVVAGTGVTLWGPLAAAAYYSYQGKVSLEKTVASLKTFDVAAAGVAALEGSNNLELALKNLQKLPTISIISRATQFVQGAKYLSDSASLLTEVIKTCLNPSLNQDQILAVAPKIKEAYSNLALASLALDQAGGVDTTLIKELLPNLKILSALAPAIPNLLGFDAPKTYLILFQNPMELRPTGGFIGSYGKLTIDHGKIVDLVLDDIYNPDGQLEQKGLGGPIPPDMAAAIPTLKKLYLRDANWWVSYPDSASRFAGLYKLATSETVAGIAAIDLYLIRDLMKITGPVYLGSYNKTITADNLYEEAEYNAESNYFTGSPQKKNFLQLLGNKLLESISAFEGKKKIELVGLINKGLAEKHLLLASFDSNLIPVLTENKWDGAVYPIPGSDFLMTVDTNIGGNKANYSVRRSVWYEVKNTYREGTMEGFLNISYQNTAKGSEWPNGSYQNFLRVLVPKGSFLNDASIQQTQATDQATPPAVKTSEDNNFTIFSLGLTVPPGQALTLKLHYTLPSDLALSPTTSHYKLRVVKQPGTDGDPFTFSMTTPFGKKLALPEGFKATAEGISFGTLLQTDLDLQIPLN